VKLKIRHSKCDVAFDYVLSGSALKGTAKTTRESFTTQLDIDSDEAMDKLVIV